MKQKIINLTLFFLLVINNSYSEESTTQTNQEQTLTLSQNWQEVIQYAQENLPLEGQLLAKSDGFGYIKVDDQYIHTLFPMLGLDEGFEEPPYFRSEDAPGAHISVFYVDENILPEEIGQTFHFELKNIATVHPSKTTSYAVLQIESHELEILREKYGLSPKLHGYEFHISLAKKTTENSSAVSDNAETDEAIANLLPETELEQQIMNDPEWIEGASWGEPRPGHPEGAIIYHILEVLNNVETFYGDSPLRENLRVLTLIHDTFKNKVDRNLPTKGENQHGMIARRFARAFIEDPVILNILQWHDDAYSAWKKGANGGDWDAALTSARSLIDALGPSIDLYVAFYTCDNTTGDKTQEPLEWFKSVVAGEVE